jgi:hypothetical protein
VTSDSRLESPWARWSRDTRELAHVTEAELLRAFVLYLTRTASNDRTVPIDGVDYELPLALGPGGRQGSKVQLVHRLLDDTYHVVCDAKLVRLHPVDLAGNARDQRARRKDAPEPTTRPPARSAADLAFERDFGAVTDDDGGVAELPDPDHPEDLTT